MNENNIVNISKDNVTNFLFLLNEEYIKNENRELKFQYKLLINVKLYWKTIIECIMTLSDVLKIKYLLNNLPDIEK